MTPKYDSRWKVLGAGIFSLILSVGIARFAYTPLLPLMQRQAGLGVTEAGVLAAINYCGYLCGAMIASRVNDLVLKDRLYRLGMVLAVLSTLAMGLTADTALWALSRFVAGLSSSAGMLLGTGLILNWLIRHHHRSELGIHFVGLGVGIAAAAAGVAAMTPLLDWQAQWWALTLMGTVLLIPALGWLPPPDRTGMTQSGEVLVDRPPSPRFMRLFMASYFCTGVGYVVSATFLVAIVDQLPSLAGKGNGVFLVVGLAAAPACIVWDLIARRTGNINALILAGLLQILGILLPVIGGTLATAMIGAVLFSGTFIGMVSLVLTMAGRYYPTRPAKMMGKMTMAYGVAQIVSPAVTGLLARHTGSYATGLYLAASAMALAVFFLIRLKRLENLEASR